jgi:cyclase
VSVRVIPRLDIKGPNLVKGVHLEGLRVLGKPEWFAKHYYRSGADELIYMDVVASLYGRNSLLEIVERTAREVLVPLTVGGGIRTLDDINTALRAGADKVSINTAAVARPDFIREAANRFGSSTIVVSIEAKRRPGGNYEVFTDNGRERTGVDAIEWASRVVALGAGEILLTSIEQEGTGQGFDVALTKRIAQAATVPVIACGGAGSLAHVVDVVKDGCADAVALASILHYDALATLDRAGGDYSDEGNVEFLRSGRANSRVKPAGIAAVKDALLEGGVSCRPPAHEDAHA